MACNCGKPHCLECLIEASKSNFPKPPDGPDLMEMIVFAVKPVPASTVHEQDVRDNHMNDFYNTLMALSALATSLDLAPALNARYKARTK